MGLNLLAPRTRPISENGCPMLTLYMENYSIKSILDTGADYSVIIKNRAPTLPMSRGPRLQGIGSQQDSLKSTNVLNWSDEDSSSVQPYIVSGLTYNLWGRDTL